MSGRANIPIVWDGAIYSNLTEACEAAGIKRGTVCYKAKKLCISKQEAFDLVLEKGKSRHNPIQIAYLGVTYATLTAACDAAGINPTTVTDRSNRLQISKQEAFDQITTSGLKWEKISILYQDIEYPTLSSACKAAGISAYTVRDKSNELHISRQEAFDSVGDKGKLNAGPIQVIYQNIVYPTLRSACNAAGINATTVSTRRRRLQISTQEAFDQEVTKDTKLHNGRVQITYQGTIYPTLSSACVAAEISVSTVYARSKRLQISTQEAFDQLVLEGVEPIKIPITYQGVTYPSVLQACKASGVSYATLFSLKKSENISAQEALDRLLVSKNDTVFMCRSIGISSNDLINVKYAYTSRSDIPYFTCTCKVCNRRILIPYETAKNYQHAEEFCVDREYKGRH